MAISGRIAYFIFFEFIFCIREGMVAIPRIWVVLTCSNSLLVNSSKENVLFLTLLTRLYYYGLRGWEKFAGVGKIKFIILFWEQLRKYLISFAYLTLVFRRYVMVPVKHFIYFFRLNFLRLRICKTRLGDAKTSRSNFIVLSSGVV